MFLRQWENIKSIHEQKGQVTGLQSFYTLTMIWLQLVGSLFIGCLLQELEVQGCTHPPAQYLKKIFE